MLKTWKIRCSLLLPLVLAAACSGSISGGDGGGGNTGGDPQMNNGGDTMGSPVGFTCDANAAGVASRFRRLTTAQYRNTLRDLVARTLGGNAAADQVMTAVSAALASLPDDHRQAVKTATYASFTRFSQEVSQELIDGSYEVAVAIGAALTQALRIGTTVGVCATDGNAGNDATCLDDFIDRFGALVLRQPLTATDREFYRSGVYGTDPKADPAAYSDLIAVFLLAPQFLLHVENGQAAVDGLSDTFQLSPHELANRLSYQFWDSMPDKDLSDAAASGELSTTDGLSNQVDRLIADPRARTALGTFFREWLRRDAIDDLTFNKNDPRFRAFAGANLPTVALKQSMIDEVEAMVQHYVFDSPGSIPDLLTSDLAFARGKELADIYGLPVWDGQGDPPRFPEGERPGLLTRAAFHAFKGAQTRPVQKGVFVRDAMLCDELPPPPPLADTSEPKISPTLSTRQVLEELTQQPGSNCINCHGAGMNPIGFATENFDSLGRVRSEQVLFDESGQEIGRAPVDTHSVPQVVYDDLTPVDGAAQLMEHIVKSGKAEACLARQYFRFTFVVPEDVDRDGCALKQMHESVANGGALNSVLRKIALVPAFQQRVIP